MCFFFLAMQQLKVLHLRYAPRSRYHQFIYRWLLLFPGGSHAFRSQMYEEYPSAILQNQ